MKIFIKSTLGTLINKKKGKKYYCKIDNSRTLSYIGYCKILSVNLIWLNSDAIKGLQYIKDKEKVSVKILQEFIIDIVRRLTQNET